VAIPEVDVGEDVFVVRDQNEAVMRVQVKSAEFIVIRRSQLSQLRTTGDVGSPDDRGNLILRLAFTADVQNKGTSFQPYRTAWEPWPPPLPAA
jgi:hypothetical protein